MSKLRLVLLVISSVACASSIAAAGSVDLSQAVIVASGSRARHIKAADMLADEMKSRTGVRLKIRGTAPQETTAIVLGTVESLAGAYSLPAGLSVPSKAEGYAIWVDTQGRKMPTVFLVGRDDRGALFAAGRLIRLARMGKGQISIRTDLRLATAPAYPLRGHMLISDGRFIRWDAAGHEQLIRDMIIFGTNSYELTDYHEFVAEILDGYGLDLWVFFGHGDVVDIKGIEDVQARFAHLKGLDHVFIPLGDTGGVRPTRRMIPAIERYAPLLKRVHPQAKIWISHQNQRHHAENDNEYLFGYIQGTQPQWLEGMVYGPWAHWDIPELRRRTPKQYKIRHYPDISHNRWSQYMIPKWDLAFANVWERNGIRAMPRMMARVHNMAAPLTEGFIAYNHTGCNNDLDKFVFSAMAWDPGANVADVLHDYAKVFFGDEFADDVAKGLLMLEDNWTGPIAQNTGIEKTLEHWKAIARRYGDISRNWRLELFLYKAFIDAYIKRKHTLETQSQAEAYQALRQAKADGVEKAIAAARAALAQVDTEFPSRKELGRELKAWVLTKYEELNEILGHLYTRPSNDRLWLEKQLARIMANQDERWRLIELDRILHWDQAGPGGYYDNLGVQGKQPHLVRQKQWHEDPGFVYSPIEFHKYNADYRQSWISTALARFDTPLLMRYEGLDRNAGYRVRATYSGPFRPAMKLLADGKYRLHGPIEQPKPMRPLEFEVPKDATADGVLELKWELTNVVRGSQVAEVWLIKQQN